MMGRINKFAIVGTSMVALVAFPGLAQAQTSGTDAAADTVANQDADVAGEQDIIVTASRAARTGFDAPTPTTVVSSETLAQRGASNVGEVLLQMPAFKPTNNPASTGLRAPTPGAYNVDLRGLGVQRSLVLVDGMRMVPQAPASSSLPVGVDLNQIPSILIDRIEVVTGGASAQWGSDAVGGVVNLILKKSYSGIELSAQSGISERGDNRGLKIGGIFGHDFADGRGQLIAGFEYVDNDGMGDIYARNWGQREFQLVTNPLLSQANPTSLILAENVHAATSEGGLISGPAGFAFRNFEFLPNGGLRPFALGSVVSGTTMIGGAGQSLSKGIRLVPSVERFAPYARASFEIAPKLSIFVEGTYPRTKGDQTLLVSRETATVIRQDNAYLNTSYPQIAAAMAPGSTLTITRSNYDVAQARDIVVNETPRIVGGLDGQLGGSWSWNIRGGWSRNMYRQSLSNNRNRALFAFATDAVLNNGQIVCRATIPGAAFNAAATGCMPINLFGAGSPSAAAIAYVTGTGHASSDYWQRTASANIKGEPFSTWAGPVSLATGFEYRHEKQVVTPDVVLNAGNYESGNSTALRGSFNVKEGYIEAIVPLARDVPGLYRLDLSGATRYADYSSAGGHWTWKLGAVYAPLNGIKLRVSSSKDLRAPAIYELGSPGARSFAAVSVNGRSATIPILVSIGNPDLRPEIAKTFTAGVVFEPPGIKGLKASVDYYNLRLTDAIAQFNSGTIANLCSLGQQTFCNAFTFNAGGAPTSLTFGTINASVYQAIGYDFSVSYNRPALGGNLAFALNGSHAAHSYIDPTGTGTPIDRAGENSSINQGSIPSWRLDASLTYSNGTWSITPQANYISAGKIDNTLGTQGANSINVNAVPAIFYLNLFSSITFGPNKAYRFGVAVRNLLDTDPPAVPNATFFQPTNPVYYDVVGRSFQVSLNVKL